MRKLNEKLKYKIVTENGNSHAEIWGTLKATGKKALFGTCHVASIAVLQKDFELNLGLIRIP